MGLMNGNAVCIRAAALGLALAFALGLAPRAAMSADAVPGAAKVSLAVMGDSNSLSYQDRVSLPNPELEGT